MISFIKGKGKRSHRPQTPPSPGKFRAPALFSPLTSHAGSFFSPTRSPRWAVKSLPEADDDVPPIPPVPLFPPPIPESSHAASNSLTKKRVAPGPARSRPAAANLRPKIDLNLPSSTSGNDWFPGWMQPQPVQPVVHKKTISGNPRSSQHVRTVVEIQSFAEMLLSHPHMQPASSSLRLRLLPPASFPPVPQWPQVL